MIAGQRRTEHDPTAGAGLAQHVARTVRQFDLDHHTRHRFDTARRAHRQFVADARREEEERLAAEAATAEREAQAQAALAEARQARDPGPAPWIVAGAGAALAVGGAVLLIVAEVDAGCVSAPNGCTDGGPRWEDFSERYDRVPIFRGVGGAALGLGAAAMAAGLVWALAGGGGGEPEVAIGPGGVRVRGHF